ncbi:MAG: ABC transporter ATP-binding protein, partial [Litorilinea sp.]
MTSAPSGATRQRPNLKNLGRAMAFLGQYAKTAAAAVIALLISIGAQLMVPQVIQNILDAMTFGLVSQQNEGL